MIRALLIGEAPPCPLGYTYVSDNYDAIVIGSLTLGQLLRFHHEEALSFLAQGKPVILYTPGLPEAKGNRALSAALAGAKRQLQSWGVAFTDGSRKTLITAEEARLLRSQNRTPPPGARLTPLAKEILEN
jgi:hypothetical protein